MIMRELDPIDYPKMLTLEILNPQENNVNDALGIPRERVDRLVDLLHHNVREAKENGHGITVALQETSKKLIHPNELCYVAMICMRMLGEKDKKSMDNEEKENANQTEMVAKTIQKM
jgi:hypothetical protein